MKIENILLEHFPRLKCANFFILFDKTFNDVPSVRVNLRPTEIVVHFANDNSTTIDLEPLNIHIQINSLSLFIAKNNLISFRINIASSFREEILTVNSTDELGSLKRIELIVKSLTKFSIICDNCSGPLSSLLCFRRILELPSENMNASDWFCHKPETHSANGHEDEGCNSINLSPAKDDLFYGNFSVSIHRSHIINIHINLQVKTIHCKRCLCQIGECVNDRTVKLWNGNIKIIHSNDTQMPARLFGNSESLFHNFLVIVERISYDYQMLGRQTLKLLFEARSSKGSTYLFIQTMARNLEIYQMNKQSMHTNRTIMMRVDGTKCLFLCEENSDPTLVQFWQKDLNVICTQISIGMLDATVERLHLLSNYVPEQFRINNGFRLSYLSYGIHS